MQQWNPYEHGYWWDLLHTAGSQFKHEWEDNPGIRSITWGVFHGGHLSIVVSVGPSFGTDFSAFPRLYAGFPVVVSGNGVTQIMKP